MLSRNQLENVNVIYKVNLKASERVELWEQGNVNEVLHQAMAIQKFCKSSPHSHRLLGKHKNFQASSIKETWTLR